MSTDGKVPAVAVSGLTKRFGRVLAVDALSLEVPPGGVFGLLGPNGSGKTTLLSMLVGFLQPTAGTIRLAGQENGASQQQARGQVGILIERPTFWPYLSCRDNLKCLQGIYGSDGGAAEIDALLEQVNLGGSAAGRRFSACSTGMKQRLGIAATLLGNPSLLILDEPTNGLDPEGIIEVRKLIRGLAANGQRTIILASHLLNEVEQVCDRVAVLARGRLLYAGSVSGMGAESRMSLRTTDDVRAAQLLEAAGWNTATPSDGAGLEVAVEPGREWEISRELAGGGVYIAEMRTTGGVLEAGFMEIMRATEPNGTGGAK